MRAFLQLLLCVGLSLSPAAAVEWRQAALWGGDVRSLAIDPAEPDRVFAGTSSGQVLLSGDGGASWAPAGLPVAFPGWVVSDLLLDGDGRLWAALWGLWGAGGNLYMSADGGATWAERGEGLPGSQVYRLASGGGRLYAATRAGVYGSDDGGTNWRHLTAAHPEIEKVSSLLVEGSAVLAGTWRRAYKSYDGGATWRGVFSGMVLDSEVFSLQPGPAAGEVWASTCGWVYRSTDGGETWVPKNQGLGGYGDLVISGIAIDPNNSWTIYLATWGYGIFKSIDRGDHWVRLSDPLNSMQMYLPMVVRNLSTVELPDTLYSIADATVIEALPSTNGGGTTDMWVGYDHCQPFERVRSLVKFDTSAIPAGTNISQATLYVYLYNSCDIGERTHRITTHRVTASWSESGVTWNNKPGYASEYSSRWIASRTWGWYSFDVTGLVQAWVNGTANYGLMLRGPESSGSDSARLGFLTKEASGTTYAPYVELSYSRSAGADERTLPADGFPEPAISGPTIHDILSGLLGTPDAGHTGYTEQSVHEPE